MAAPKKTTTKTVKPAAVAVPVTPAIAPVVERSEIKASGTPKAPAITPRMITHEMITKRAYEIYANRGYTPGDQNADWLEAERQLKAGL